MKVIKNKDNKYLVLGAGFVAVSATEATRIEDNELDEVRACLGNVGLNVDLVIEDAPVATGQGSAIQNADGSSFGVRFVRPKEVRKDGSIAPLNKRKLSPRRFRTSGEAIQHGARFARIEGHAGFVLVKTQEKVNSWVNEGNGKTNPEIGKKRVNRL